MMNKVQFGRAGEDITCKYLLKNNYKIIDRNFYYKGGELDIIAFDCDTSELVFIEVKTRANNSYGVASEAVTDTKISNMKKGMKLFLYRNHLNDTNVRVDIVEVYYAKSKFFIRHTKQVM